MRATRVTAVLAAAGLAMVTALPPAWGETDADQDRADAAVATAHDDLVEANSKVAKAVEDLEDARAKLPEARAALATARAESNAAAAADRAAQAALEQATAAAIRAEQERAEIEFQIQDLQGRVGNLAREVYQSGSMADFDLLISADSPTELADRAAAIDAVSRVNNSTLATMAATRAELRLKEARLEAMKVEVQNKRLAAADALEAANQAKAKAQSAKTRVDALVAQRASALDVAASERADVLAQYKSVQAEQERIAALLAKEAARLARGGDGSFDPTTGSYIWPVTGASISQKVGPRVHPVYGYRSCHTGIDLGAASGTPIRATAAGVVVSTEKGGPYGWHTLIAHGDGIFSMYAHQSRFGVSEGETVTAGQVVGYVGSTGWVTGPHLHFEIHVGSTPYDPLGWFGGTKEPVNC